MTGENDRLVGRVLHRGPCKPDRLFLVGQLGQLFGAVTLDNL